MRILSWNVRFESPDKLIKKIQSEHLDIVTLQEFTLNQTNEWVSRLKDIDLPYHCVSGYAGQTKRFRSLIASCWPISPADTQWRVRACG